jgi:hypothetical protein
MLQKKPDSNIRLFILDVLNLISPPSSEMSAESPVETMRFHGSIIGYSYEGKPWVSRVLHE